MTEEVYIVAAKRTPVAPRGGKLSTVAVHDLASRVITSLLDQISIDRDAVDYVILGNALYGGGNPARLAALQAGLSESVPANTVDTQCCSGMDAIALGKSLIRAGQCDVVLAGGLESYSRAPRRFARGEHKGVDQEYSRPPFTPWPERDPDMIEAAALLAKSVGLSRSRQEQFAIQSHYKARQGTQKMSPELVDVEGLLVDQFTRELTATTCARLPIVTGEKDFALTSATISVEADGAAVCLLVSTRALEKFRKLTEFSIRIAHSKSLGSNPENPALAPIDVSRAVLSDMGITPEDIDVAEVMEAFASQALVCIDEIGLKPERVNLSGGGLARGHPIGASGAINLVRLFHEMRHNDQAKFGLATIAGAGGLGSAVVLAK